MINVGLFLRNKMKYDIYVDAIDVDISFVPEVTKLINESEIIITELDYSDLSLRFNAWTTSVEELAGLLCDLLDIGVREDEIEVHSSEISVNVNQLRDDLEVHKEEQPETSIEGTCVPKGHYRDEIEESIILKMVNAYENDTQINFNGKYRNVSPDLMEKALNRSFSYIRDKYLIPNDCDIFSKENGYQFHHRWPTAAERKQAVKRVKAGESVFDVSEDLEVSQKQVSKWVREASKRKTSNRKYLTTEQKKYIFSSHRKGISAAKIAEDLGCNRRTVNRYVSKANS